MFCIFCLLGIYETPGGAILIAAHLDIEAFTMDKVWASIECGCVPIDTYFYLLVIQEKYIQAKYFEKSKIVFNGFLSQELRKVKRDLDVKFGEQVYKGKQSYKV